MIGYHYTTWEAYQLIRETGLQLSKLEERHKFEFPGIAEYVEDGCIWVYPEYMQGRELIGMVFYVGIHHDSHRLVCLEVDYPEWHSVSRLVCRKYEDDPDINSVNLNHDLVDAGPFNHTRKRFDLITEPVSLDRIQVVGEWDLVSLIQQGERRLRVVA